MKIAFKERSNGRYVYTPTIAPMLEQQALKEGLQELQDGGIQYRTFSYAVAAVTQAPQEPHAFCSVVDRRGARITWFEVPPCTIIRKRPSLTLGLRYA